MVDQRLQHGSAFALLALLTGVAACQGDGTSAADVAADVGGDATDDVGDGEPDAADRDGADTADARVEPSLTPTTCPSDIEQRASALGAEIECGVLAVPLDHAEPGGETLELFVTRTLARDEDARVGLLVRNGGGPGYPDASAQGNLDTWISAPEVAAAFDIVSFDPRGTGASQAIDCWDEAPLYDLDQTPDTEAERVALREAHEAWADACAQSEQAHLLPFLDTAQVAGDMDWIRAALGAETISYLGYSYGAHLGLFYMQYYPERVRAFVLDAPGPIGPGLTDKVELQTAGIDASLAAFLAWCADEQSECALREHADEPRGAAELDALFRELHADFESRFEAGELGDAFASAFEFASAVSLLSYRDWPLLAEALAELADLGLIGGDGRRFGVLDVARLYRLDTNDPYQAIMCASFPHATVAELDALADELSPVSPLGWFGTYEHLACAYWPNDAAEYEPFVYTGEAPVLVIGGLRDPAQPYSLAVEVADQLGPRGRLLTVDDYGHTFYRRSVRGSGCVDPIVEAYLLELELPDEDTICEGLPEAVVAVCDTACDVLDQTPCTLPQCEDSCLENTQCRAEWLEMFSCIATIEPAEIECLPGFGGVELPFPNAESACYDAACGYECCGGPTSLPTGCDCD